MPNETGFRIDDGAVIGEQGLAAALGLWSHQLTAEVTAGRLKAFKTLESGDHLFAGADVNAWLGRPSSATPTRQPTAGARHGELQATPRVMGAAEQQFYQHVDARMVRGQSRERATAGVVRDLPHLRDAMVQEFNDNRGRRRL